MPEKPGGYDAFASEAFAPFYPLYARDIMERTGVRSGQLLDLGSGGGHLGFALMDAGSFERVTFADLSASQLDNARARAEARGYTQDECSFVETDAVDLGAFVDESFDLVVSRGSMQFWGDQEAAVREVYRVLKPGGYGYLGGGIGTNYRLTKRIEGLMSEIQHKYGIGHGKKKSPDEAKTMAHDRRVSRNDQCHRFIDLFAELGCSYTVMNSKGEGGWYIFCKDSHLPW